MTSFLSMSFQALTDRKLRSTLTILMVVIGVALIVAVNGLSTGITVFVDEQFEALGPNLLIVQTGSGGLSNIGAGGGSQGSNEDVMITDRDVEEMALIEGIQHIVPYIQTNAMLSHLDKEEGTLIVGIDTTKLPLIYPQFEVVKGNDLTTTDSYGMLLGSSLADIDGEDPFADVGDTVKAQYLKSTGYINLGPPEYATKSFTIRGIGGEIGISTSFIPFDRSAYISLSVANQFFDKKGEYDGLYILTEDPDLNVQVEDALKETYDVSVISPTAIAETASLITGALGGFLDSIAIVSLGVAAVGIITTLWTSMMERTKEIGTLKALGYSKRQILVLFLNEALFIGVIGGLIGMIIGVYGGSFLSEITVEGFATGADAGGFTLTPVFDPMSLIIMWAVAVVLSVVAGFYPAKKAADLDPVVALRKD